MKTAKLPRKRQSGMSLIEVLISLLIFSFAFLGLIAMQGRAVQASTDAEDRSRAAMMASEIVATMWTQKNMALPATTITDWQARVANPAASGLPGSSGTISAPDTDGVVTVTVTWRAPARLASDQSSQYVTQVVMP